MGTRVVLAGYFGFGNLGDEAILAAELPLLRARLGSESITVLSGAPDRTRALHGVAAVAWDDLPAVRAAVAGSEALVLAGGGVFQDHVAAELATVLTRGHAGITTYATPAYLAMLLGKPLIIHAVGVGPLAGETARRLTRSLFEQAVSASVRDEQSLDVLASLGVATDGIAVTADPAFALDHDADGAREALATVIDSGERRLIGVALREWPTDAPVAWETQLAAALDRLAETGAEILFIPFQQVDWPNLDDVKAAEGVRGQLRHGARSRMLATQERPDVMAGVLGRCDVVVGMRLHALILAAVAQVPLVALAYDDKVRHLMTKLDLEASSQDLAQLVPDQLAALIQEAIDERHRRSQRLAPLVAGLRAQAAAGIEQLAGTLSDPPPPRAQLSPTTQRVLRDLVLAQSATLEQHARELADVRTELRSATAQEAELRARAEAQQRDLDRATQVLDSYERREQRLRDELDRHAAQQEVLAGERDAHLAALNSIYGSRGWRALNLLWAARRAVAPQGSVPDRVARKAVRTVRQGRPAVRGLAGRAAVRAIGASASAVLDVPGLFEDRYVVEDNSVVTLFTDDPALFPGYQPRLRLSTPPGTVPARVTLVAIMRNEREGIHRWVRDLLAQTRHPDELLVVDDESTDGSADRLRAALATSPFPTRVLEPGRVRMARGRNLAIEAARNEIIAVTDLGVGLPADWLEKIVAPFELAPETEVVAGFYAARDRQGRTLHRRLWPTLDDLSPQEFIPASRSIAFRREAWRKAGGYPEWLTLTAEDTYFAMELKRYCRNWGFVPEARVDWDAPDTLAGYWRKARYWSAGDGEVGYGGSSHQRSLARVAAAAAGLPALPLAAAGGAARGWRPSRLALGCVGVSLAALAVTGRRAGASPTALLAESGAQVGRALGFVEGARRREAVYRRREEALHGVLLFLTGVPIDDTGGGARGTQLALEFLRQGWKVVFVNRFPKQESLDLDLRIADPNLETSEQRDFDMEAFLDRQGAILGTKPVAGFVEFPLAEFLPTVRRLKQAGLPVLYDLIDDWETSLGAQWYTEATEREIVAQADVLIGTAPSLVQRLTTWSNRQAELLPNAVNLRLFDAARPHPRPADLTDASWRIAYVGALWGDWFDWDLLVDVARHHPDAAVVVIGDYRGQSPATPPNLHFLGLKSQREVPAYLAHMDVAIIPWLVNDITRATSPLKLFEYLAMRLPVVAPDLPPLRSIPFVLRSPDREAFLANVAQARGVQAVGEGLEAFLAEHSWQARVAQLIELIEKAGAR